MALLNHLTLRSRCRTCICALLACLFLGAVGFRAVGQDASREYEVKAVFLFNFAQFTEWPPTAFANARSPLVIGILGRDPFGRFLDNTVRDEQVNGHALQVVRYHSVEEITSCHMLFISQSEVQRLPAILSALEGKAVLTVSDVEGFARSGGMVRFITEKNKVRFRINVEAAQRAGLQISSKLLRFAEIVTTEKEN